VFATLPCREASSRLLKCVLYSLTPSICPLRGSQDANWTRNCFYNLVFCHLLLFLYSYFSFLSPRRISFCGKGKGSRHFGWGGGASSVRGRTFLEWKNKKCCLVTAVMYYYVHDFFNTHFSSSPSYLSLFICLSVPNLHCLINEGDMDDLWWWNLIFLHRNLRRVNATWCLGNNWTATWNHSPLLQNSRYPCDTANFSTCNVQ
jgi:hypothetical protein